MPQGKRRSISYRSFVTCDNPKGVVECGVIRKSKINNNSQKREQQHHEHNFKVVDKKLGISKNTINNNNNNNNNNSNNKSLLLVNNKEDKKVMCIEEVTRELDVSKVGHEVNHVNDSWDKVKRLSSMQRTYRTDEAYGKRPQQKSTLEELISKDLLKGALDLQESLEMLGRLQEEGFSSFMSKSRRKQKGNVDDGSSSFECMVNGVVSNERLQMGGGGGGVQRPRKATDNGEMKNVVRDSLLRQNVITNPIFEENYFDHRMPSTSSSRSSSMLRSSNFVPSDSSSSSSSITQRRRKRDSNLIFKLMGLESPPLSPRCHKEDEKAVNLRKGQFGAQVLGNKQRSVDEILETLHFKGLLRSNSVNGVTCNAVESEVFSSKNRCYDERPPIVIMKPFMPKFWHESCVPEFGANFSEEGGKFANKTGFCKAMEPVNQDLKHRTKYEAPRISSEVEKVSPARRKGEESKPAKFGDGLSFGDQQKLHSAPIIMQQKDGRFISKQKHVISTPVNDQRNEQISEISGQRKKNRQSTRADDHGKRKGKEKEAGVSMCVNKNVLPVVKSIVFDSIVEQKKSRVCRNQIRDDNVGASTEHRQNDKSPISDVALAGAHEHGSVHDDSHSCYSEINSVSTSEHYSPVCEVTLVTTHENGVPVDSLGGKPPSSPCESKPEPSKESLRTQLQTLLLSSLSILNNPEDLFDMQLFTDLVPFDVGRDRFLIDYANEVIRLRSSDISPYYLPQKPFHTKETRNLPPFDRLLEDIGNGLEDLKRYHRSDSDDTFCSDNLYLILDRDLRFKNGVWETGWRTMFSRDEFEAVVRQVDRIILGKLIEEVVLDFMVL
ncbi:hypothetical protein vseg_016363 [Gypsophila vaccaria]